MLLELAVADLALLERVRLPLGPGLTVLTGETGAGKSLLIDAILLVAGARADGSLLRAGATSARVEALFDRVPEPLIAVREVTDSGRSVARIDDETARPPGVERKRAELLIGIGVEAEFRPQRFGVKAPAF